jgi:manganese/zinc/iron transport system substrate-binding protein
VWLLLRVTLGLLGLLCVASGVASCGPDQRPAAAGDAETGATGDGPYTVVATVGMIEDVVRQVAGERARVIGLIGTGVDPHLYKPTRSDLSLLLSADMIVYNGLLLEGRMTDTLIRAAASGKPVYAVTELLDEAFLLEPQDAPGHTDPHVWMDPSAWTGTVEVIRDRLSAFDPEGEAVYRQNAEAYTRELEALDAYAQGVLSSVPEGRRVLVTAHDAFNYFGRRFGYEVVGLQGLSTESEAGVRDIERLVDLLVGRGVTAVFVESTVSARNITALIAGAGARGHTVALGGSLFSDAMGEPGTYEGTYVGMIDHNVTTIARALGGQAPAGGMRGRLAAPETR